MRFEQAQRCLGTVTHPEHRINTGGAFIRRNLNYYRTISRCASFAKQLNTSLAFCKGLSYENNFIFIIHELAYSTNRTKQTYIIFVKHSTTFHTTDCSTKSSSTGPTATSGTDSWRFVWRLKSNTTGVDVVLRYVDDITEGMSLEICMFADDCVIYCQIPTDLLTFQYDLDKLVYWLKMWQVFSFNYNFNLNSVVFSSWI